MAYTDTLDLKKQQSLSVCFFSHSAYLNGAERSLLELVTQLVRYHGVVCSVILPGHGPLEQRFEAVGVPTHVVRYSPWTARQVPPQEKMHALCSNSLKSLLYAIRDVIGEIDPDVIATNTMSIPWGAIAASLMGKPHVWFVREFVEADHGLRTFLPFDVTLDVVMDFSDLIVTNSNAVRKALFPTMGQQKVIMVYPYVKIEPAALDQEEASHFLRPNAIRLIISGAVQEGKGQEDAVLAVRELVHSGRNPELIVMGHFNVDYAEHLRAIIAMEKLENHVKFVGLKANPYPTMNQADIVLVCSRREAFGRVTVEGMLLKKPVIGTNTGGTPELIKDGYNGLLYEPGDYSQLAARIQHLADHPVEAKRLAETGYQFATKTFTRSEYGGKICELLKALKRTGASDARHSGLPLQRPAALDALLTPGATNNPRLAALLTGLGSSVTALELQIQRIQRSGRVRPVSNYQRLIETLLRPGTRRRYYYELGLSGLGVIVTEGWPEFFRRTKRWVRSRRLR